MPLSSKHPAEQRVLRVKEKIRKNWRERADLEHELEAALMARKEARTAHSQPNRALKGEPYEC